MMTLFLVTVCKVSHVGTVQLSENCRHMQGNQSYLYSSASVYSEHSLLIVFKFTGTKIISLYLQYITHDSGMYTHFVIYLHNK